MFTDGSIVLSLPIYKRELSQYINNVKQGFIISNKRKKKLSKNTRENKI